MSDSLLFYYTFRLLRLTVPIEVIMYSFSLVVIFGSIEGDSYTCQVQATDHRIPVPPKIFQ